MSRDRSCEERILEHLNSRVADFKALSALASVYSADDLSEALEDAGTRSMYEEIKPTDFEEIGSDMGDLNEAARERMYEYPLGVSQQTVFRVDISTGGPGDWLEVVCTGDTPRYEVRPENGEYYEVERITYHFNDWFDHAERPLEGPDYDAALAFVSHVIGALVD